MFWSTFLYTGWWVPSFFFLSFSFAPFQPISQSPEHLEHSFRRSFSSLFPSLQLAKMEGKHYFITWYLSNWSCFHFNSQVQYFMFLSEAKSNKPLETEISLYDTKIICFEQGKCCLTLTSPICTCRIPGTWLSSDNRKAGLCWDHKANWQWTQPGAPRLDSAVVWRQVSGTERPFSCFMTIQI